MYSFFFLNYILHMRNFEDFIIEISDGNYIIDLSYFHDAEHFNSYLLDFLGYYAMLKKDINSKYIILGLEFNHDFLKISHITFLFPYVDRGLSFKNIYIFGLNSNLVNLRINII